MPEGTVLPEECARCLIIRNGCRSIWCPRCGPGRGMRLRDRLLVRYAVKNVGRVGFATLTCSPALLGADLQSQFERVKNERLVARFVRLYGKLVGRRVDYLSIMEFHKRSGQVHFHLALDDCGKLSRAALRLLQAWCQRHMGTFDYKYMPSTRAVRYCLKYLTKGSQEAMPDWCAEYKGPIRAYTASHGFWHDSKPRREPRTKGQPRVQRTLRARFERCENAGVVGIEEKVTDDGEVKRRFAFCWPHPFDAVVNAAVALVTEEELPRLLDARSSFAIAWDRAAELSRRVLGGVAPVRRAAAAGAAP